ncbi:MAG: hypothetical protein H0Z28_10185 [Archaeoglobus sp.]|nr:hypothetical protein [Archaeoglobus sp.]
MRVKWKDFEFELKTLKDLELFRKLVETLILDRSRNTQERLIKDSVTLFIIEKLEISPEDFIPKEELYKSYCEYCRQNKLPIAHKTSFARQLTKQLEVNSYRPKLDGKRISAWKGVRFKKERGSEDTEVDLDFLRRQRLEELKVMRDIIG